MRHLLNPSRDFEQLRFGLLLTGLGAAVFGVLVLVAGTSGGRSVQDAIRVNGSIGRHHPSLRRGLDVRRNAHRRLSVARRVRVPNPASPPAAPAETVPPGVQGPSPQGASVSLPVALPTPAAEPTPPSPAPAPAPETPQPPPAPEPIPPPPPAPSPAPEPPPTPQPAGEVLFKATFDSGFGGWYVQSLPGRASISNSDPYQGAQAARFEVRQGDVEPDTGSQRSEVSGPTFSEGEDLYFRDAIRVPSGNTFSTPWQIIQQLHEEDWNGSPGLAVFLDATPSLRIGAGDGSPTYWTSSILEEDRWYELVYRVMLSQDPSIGFVEVWLDGARQSLVNGQTRMYGQTTQRPETYLKAGIYRSKSSTGTSIVEHDAIVVGTSYAAVTSG